MKVGIKILRQENGVQRVYLSEIENALTGKEVLTEVFRGRQATGNFNESIFIRCGEDANFYSVKNKADIENWINERLKRKGK